jgi:hypothetical protein
VLVAAVGFAGVDALVADQRLQQFDRLELADPKIRRSH